MRLTDVTTMPLVAKNSSAIAGVAASITPAATSLAVTELDEQRRRGREVVDHDARVLRALDRHALDDSDARARAA
jgi:hypothetical protein